MNVQELLERLENKQILTEREVKLVCERAKEILFEESNVTPVFAPVTVCGDVHGQFFDVLELFRKGGKVPSTNYIFIGDFVDRGYNSVETFEYLLCLKILYPGHITLLRGNHESRQITTVYGFYDEITRKYGNTNPWKQFVDVFDYLPLGALIESQILCIHGGLSPSIKTIDQMRQIDRKLEIPHEGAFCDLMWSDPEEIETWALSNRGAGWLFGGKVTKEFSELNGLNLICRAHQLVQEGYQFWFPEKSLVTVWSAPNYCYRCGNIAAILQIKESMEREFITFKEVPESAKSVQPRNVLPYFL